jgi:hypothetical protein
MSHIMGSAKAFSLDAARSGSVMAQQIERKAADDGDVFLRVSDTRARLILMEIQALRSGRRRFQSPGAPGCDARAVPRPAATNSGNSVVPHGLPCGSASGFDPHQSLQSGKAAFLADPADTLVHPDSVCFDARMTFLTQTLRIVFCAQSFREHRSSSCLGALSPIPGMSDKA